MAKIASLLCLTTSLGLPALAAPADDPEPHALVISGGVSLGAYEAGFNWALVSAMKRSAALTLKLGKRRRPVLTAVTGASAGSVNAVLSALHWCARPADIGTVEDNLFYHAWMDVGFDTLMPALEDYAADDGILARASMDSSIGRLRCRLQGIAYDKENDRCLADEPRSPLPSRSWSD